MTTPPILVDWLTEKVETYSWAGVREARTVAHTWRRATGGRVLSAALSASITPSQEFRLLVEAPNVEAEYVAAARNGVVTVLLSQSHRPVLACTLTLFAFQPHPEDSCYAAFYAVAAEATKQLLGVAAGFPHNIEW
jgi:hypothetical protein